MLEGCEALLLGVTPHEWLDIAVDSSGAYLMWASLACTLGLAHLDMVRAQRVSTSHVDR